MKNKELIREVAKRTGVTHSGVKEILRATVEVITEALSRGEKVHVTRLGVFKVRHNKPKTFYNIVKGDLDKTKHSKSICFKVSDLAKEQLN